MNDSRDFYIYVGYADDPRPNKSRRWKLIRDTPEERQRAIEDGYKAGGQGS